MVAANRNRVTARIIIVQESNSETLSEKHKKGNKLQSVFKQ